MVYVKDMNYLAVDITHKCNLSCSFCIKKTWDSDFEMTAGDLIALDYCVDLPIKTVRISGGEALVHPKFKFICESIMTMFSKPIELATNGLALHKYEDMIPTFAAVHITVYPGVNDEAIEKYRQYPNVNIITRSTWYDLDIDPQWSYERATQARDRCCFRQINITGRKVYGCCMGEIIDRVHGVQGLWVELKESWREEYQKLDVTPGCQHCCIAVGEGQ